jgi:BirA family biotin operon repressor/biotin-[acetyl-CoA-carboxylase] ligase
LNEYIKETASTNADLAARLSAGQFVPEGQWLVADRQTAGRGRQGREWFDGHGNFMGSTVVHRRFADPEPATLALLAGLAVHEAVSLHLSGAQRAKLKWPNDVMIGNAKLAGILMEREGDSVVVGVGVNLAIAPQLADRETIALADLAPRPDRDSFAEDLARHFDLELERWRNFGMAPIIKRWLAVAHPVGTQLEVVEPGETRLTGTFAGIGEDGSLQLRLADGATRAIHAGEVNLVSLGR